MSHVAEGLEALRATAAAWRVVAEACERGAWGTVAGGVHVAASGVLSPGLNCAVVTDEPDDAGAAARETLSFFARSAIPFSVHAAMGMQSIIDAFTHLGLTRGEELPTMVFDSPDAVPVAVPDGVRIEPVDSADRRRAAAAVLAAAFGSPVEAMHAFLPDALYAHDGVGAVVAVTDRGPVATGMSITSGDAIGIYAVGTHPDHRGAGLGAACTAAVVREGAQRRGAWAYLQASKMGEPVYARIGFREVLRTCTLTWTPPTAC